MKKMPTLSQLNVQQTVHSPFRRARDLGVLYSHGSHTQAHIRPWEILVVGNLQKVVGDTSFLRPSYKPTSSLKPFP